MKKILTTLILLLAFANVYSQSDTIFNKNKTKIACKITEINEYDIKYKLTGLDDSPIFTVNKYSVIKYTLSNGFTEVIVHDELSLENEHSEIIKNRSVIKMHPFSFINHQVSFAYEKVLKVGTNLDFEAGYINWSISPYSVMNNNKYTGAYFKPGIKFLMGQDFTVRGIKYSHPLKGRYIKLDLAMSFLNFDNLQRYVYNGTYPNQTATLIQSDLKMYSYGGFVNYGRQFILGNILTMDYFVGMGYTGLSYSYSNPDYTKNYNNYIFVDNTHQTISNFHGYFRIPTVGLSFTAGFRIGYILPDPAAKKRNKVISK